MGSKEGQELREGERRRAGSSSPPPKADRHTSVMHYRPEHNIKNFNTPGIKHKRNFCGLILGRNILGHEKRE